MDSKIRIICEYSFKSSCVNDILPKFCNNLYASSKSSDIKHNSKQDILFIDQVVNNFLKNSFLFLFSFDLPSLNFITSPLFESIIF